jgi:hypothetical protein
MPAGSQSGFVSRSVSLQHIILSAQNTRGAVSPSFRKGGRMRSPTAPTRCPDTGQPSQNGPEFAMPAAYFVVCLK